MAPSRKWSGVKAAYPDKDIKIMRQPGKGKADAVFTAFDVARGDVLMILDADLTMPPEQLPKFWDAVHSGKGEFVNGSRLVYAMDDGAMRFLNLIANRIFSYLFSWLLNQRYTDNAVRHQGDAPKRLPAPEGRARLISAISIRSAIST